MNPHDLVPGLMTQRQRQILSMFCSGWSSGAIARELGLAVGTINPTLRAACVRLGGTGRINRLYLTEIATKAAQLDHYPVGSIENLGDHDPGCALMQPLPGFSNEERVHPGCTCEKGDS